MDNSQTHIAKINAYMAQNGGLDRAQTADMQVRLDALGYATNSIKADGRGDGSKGPGTARAALEFIHDQTKDGAQLPVVNDGIREMLSEYNYLERAQNLNSSGIGALLEIDNLTKPETMRLQTLLGVNPDGIIGDVTRHEIINFVADNPELMGSMSEDMLEAIHKTHPERVTAIAVASPAFQQRVQTHVGNLVYAQDLTPNSAIKEIIDTTALLVKVSGSTSLDDMKQKFPGEEQSNSKINTHFKDTVTPGEGSAIALSQDDPRQPTAVQKPGGIDLA